MAAQFQHLVNSFGQEIEDKVSKNRDKDIATSFLAVHRFGFFHLQSNCTCTFVLSASTPLTSSHKVCRRLLQYDRGNGEKHRNYGIVSFLFHFYASRTTNTEMALNVEVMFLILWKFQMWWSEDLLHISRHIRQDIGKHQCTRWPHTIRHSYCNTQRNRE